MCDKEDVKSSPCPEDVSCVKCDERDGRDEQCHPRCLAPLARPSVFSAIMALVLIIELAAISGYFGAITSTLEKQFFLSSSEVGALSIINDVVSLLTVGLFTYFGHNAHRPRIVGAGAVLVGVGTVVCAMPHFIVGSYSPIPTNTSSDNQEFCNAEPGEINNDESNSSNEMINLYLFIIGQVIVGIGNAPIIPLAMTYIDDAVDNHKTSVYIAAVYIGTSIGPMVGFVMSSFTLSIYVDFDSVSRADWPAANRGDPRWVGAWWLGLLIFGSLIVVVAVPLFLFPKRLRPVKDHLSVEGPKEAVELRGGLDRHGEEEKPVFSGTAAQNESHVGDSETKVKLQVQSTGSLEVFIHQVKDFMSALLRLGRNLTLVSLTLGLCSELAIVSGLTTFGAKYMEVQFHLDPGQAGLITGVAILPASCIGHLLAGFIIRQFKLSAFKCSILLCVTVSITLCIYPVMIFLGCDNPDVRSSSSACMEQCSCNATVLNPVCGANVTYTSPCIAGCTGKDEIYRNCSCVTADSGLEKISVDTPSIGGTAQGGACIIVCSMMVAYIATSSISLFFMFMGQNPTMIINLRCVEKRDRSFAIGMVTCVVKVLGFFPAPVYFGAVINTACLMFKSSEGNIEFEDAGNSVCWLYDLPAYRQRFFALLIGLKSCTLLCFLVLLFSLWRKTQNKVY